MKTFLLIVLLTVGTARAATLIECGGQPHSSQTVRLLFDGKTLTGPPSLDADGWRFVLNGVLHPGPAHRVTGGVLNNVAKISVVFARTPTGDTGQRVEISDLDQPVPSAIFETFGGFVGKLRFKPVPCRKTENYCGDLLA